MDLFFVFPEGIVALILQAGVDDLNVLIAIGQNVGDDSLPDDNLNLYWHRLFPLSYI